jgi:hypothetical protein
MDKTYKVIHASGRDEPRLTARPQKLATSAARGFRGKEFSHFSQLEILPGTRRFPYRPRVPVMERFWAKVEMVTESGCWIWTGATCNGYGQFTNEHSWGEAAHRFAYRTLRGPISHGKQIDHLCRVTCCVNPHHLEVVSQHENLLRRDYSCGYKERPAVPWPYKR